MHDNSTRLLLGNYFESAAGADSGNQGKSRHRSPSRHLVIKLKRERKLRTNGHLMNDCFKAMRVEWGKERKLRERELTKKARQQQQAFIYFHLKCSVLISAV